SSLYRRDSHWATAERPRFWTLAAYRETLFSGNLKRFWMREVSSRMRRPCSPRTSWVCVARMTVEKLELVFYFPLQKTVELRSPRRAHRKSRSRTDISDGGSHSDFDTRVALLGQLALEELVEFGIEDTVGDELATLADGAWLG